MVPTANLSGRDGLTSLLKTTLEEISEALGVAVDLNAASAPDLLGARYRSPRPIV